MLYTFFVLCTFTFCFPLTKLIYFSPIYHVNFDGERSYTSFHKITFCPFWTNFAPLDTKDIQWRWRKWWPCTSQWKSTGGNQFWCSSLPGRRHPGITHGKNQCCCLWWVLCTHCEITVAKAGTETSGFIPMTSNCIVNTAIQKALWKITIITEKCIEHTLIFYMFVCIE